MYVHCFGRTSKFAREFKTLLGSSVILLMCIKYKGIVWLRYKGIVWLRYKGVVWLRYKGIVWLRSMRPIGALLRLRVTFLDICDSFTYVCRCAAVRACLALFCVHIAYVHV